MISFRKVVSRLTTSNSSRYYLEKFASEAGERVKKNATILDAGAGDCIYRKYFEHAKYESADFCQVDKFYAPVTYVCDLDKIPVEKERYDFVFLSQVLEHLPNPESVLKELNRVLKPNGELWLSAPFFYEEHEKPYDFYRYTQFGFTHLLNKAGYMVKSISWLEGYYGTMGYQFKTMYRSIPINPRHYGKGIGAYLSALLSILLKPLFFLLMVHFNRLDKKFIFTDSGYCKNYKVVAIKKSEL
ncbi:MAG: class I SAM-dependent methyltransferase [Reichenbachiella sp.]|uniref:class I SAM-dependent methyltransferase n=1 Tax=Reichenbachiella sp. TaxID=2184521 RepID=UPI0032978903